MYRIRGTLNSLIELACNVGILLELIASSYLSYEVQAWMFIAISLVFMMTFVFFPETPDYLERSQKKMVGKVDRDSIIMFLFQI